MKTLLLTLLALALNGSTLWAASSVSDEPQTANLQTAIRSVIANNRTPISIDVVRGDPLMIEFPEGEIVNDIAVGGISDWKNSWELVKRGNRLFLRLLHSKETERKLLVTTSSHSYVFFLQPHDRKDGRLFVSKLTVSFEKPRLLSKTSLGNSLVAPAPSPPRAPVVSKRNYDYSMEVVKETVDIRPRAVYDDGRFTSFLFPNNIPIPAIYRTVTGSEKEALINWHISGDYVVVHGISPAWNLRFEDSVIGVFNEKYNAEGISTPRNTTNGEIRESIQ